MFSKMQSSKTSSFSPRWRTPLLAVASALLTGAGCADGIITDEGTPPDPVFTVQAEAIGALTLEGEPRGALAWTVYDPGITDCLAEIDVEGPLNFESDEDWEKAGRLQRCFFFSERGRVETDSVAIEAEFPAAFAIDVETLPSGEYLSGNEGARIGFADVYVYVDDNGNQQFDETPRGALFHVDKLVGTSRPIERFAEEISFTVYREGELSPLWKLYSALYGCPEPEPGFSTVTITDADEYPSTCVIDSRPMPVQLYDEGQAQFLACAPDPQATTVTMPTDAEPLPAGVAMQCGEGDFGRSLYTTDEVNSVCPTVREYALVGCSDFSSEDACRATFWDIENNEPSWWPCGSSRVLVYGTAPETFATNSIDVIATFSWGEGEGQVPFDALVVTATFAPDSEAQVVGAEHIEISDNDGNGVFNRGDSLVVREPSNLFTPQSAPGNYTIYLDSEVPLATLDREHLGGVSYVPVQLPAAPQIEISAADAADPVQVGPAGVFTVTYTSESGPAFAIEKLSAGAYVGGEYPIRLQAVALEHDANGDGEFGPGDTLLFEEDASLEFNDVDPEMVQNFGPLLYVDLRAEYAFNTVGAIGYAEVTIE